MHPHLQRHLRKLGLDKGFASLTPESWELFLERVSRSYTDADQEAYLLERSLTIASREMEALHEQLTAAVSRYSDLYNEAPALYIVTQIVDGQHVISDCNERTLQVLGYAREQLVGHPISVVYQNATPVDLQVTGQTQACAIVDAKGACLDTVARAVLEQTESGLVQGARIMFLDLSGHMELREALQANRAKSEFLSRMSHELRTPMNAVLGFAQLLELDSTTDGQREHLAHIMSAGRHMLRIIDEILEISRIESGKLELAHDAFAPGSIVEEVIEMVMPLAISAGIELTLDPVPTEVWARGDRQRTSQILVNLVANAIKYNRNKGSVRLTVDSDENRVVIRVRDTGIGIAERDFDQIFEPFHRLGAERTTIPGTGLGLALSNRLAEAMDGALSVVSEIGVGSTFSLELPRSGEAARRVQSDYQPYERAA